MTGLTRWLRRRMGITHWILGYTLGIVSIVIGTVGFTLRVQGYTAFWVSIWLTLALSICGIVLVGMSARALTIEKSPRITAYYDNSGASRIRIRGPKVVAIGGGTGLPSALRALKSQTHDITAVVTVADDGGSSGRLRRDLGVPPPGDLRNNIVALADDESIMAKLFQYRFSEGDLAGHSFGNLFISVLASITDGGLETALIETQNILNIQGRVLPSTLQDINLRAQVQLPGKKRTVTIFGEAAIGDAGGHIEHLEIVPHDVAAYPESVNAIVNADIIVIGPGSLYTSLLPNLLVADIANALRASHAYIVYICNISTQPGETEGYTVAEHVLAIEKMIGRGVFHAVLANDHFPPPKPNTQTKYVQKVADNHPLHQRYEIVYSDLTDDERPWRHDPKKLATALINLYEAERAGQKNTKKVTLHST